MAELIPRPPLPTGIIDAINRMELAIFVGAGVSVLTGCYTWDDLATHMVDRAVQAQILNFANAELIKAFHNNKKILGIIESIYKSHGRIDEFRKALIDGIERKDERLNLEIYESLQKFLAINITTNADSRFDSLFAQSKIVRGVAEYGGRFHADVLYKIHGCVTEYDSLIFTVNQYIKAYQNDKGLPRLLANLFTTKTVFFVGYSLSEFELLQYVLQRQDSERRTHYWLKEYYYQYGKEIVDYEHQYYLENYSIEIIPYYKDENGWNELRFIIDEWAKAIPIQTNYIPANLSQLDYSGSTPESIASAIYRAEQNPRIAEYLFRKLADIPEPSRWWQRLAVSPLLAVKNHPEPVAEQTNNGIVFRELPWWPSLYLQNLSTENFVKRDEEISNFLLKMVMDLNAAQGRYPQRNFRTDRTLIFLLGTIPLEHIKLENLEIVSEIITGDRGDGGFELKEKLAPNVFRSARRELIALLLKQILTFELAGGYDFPEFGKVFKLRSALTDHWLKEVIEPHKDHLTHNHAKIVTEICLNTISDILGKDEAQFTKYQIKSFSDNFVERGHSRPEYAYIVSDLLRDSILELEIEAQKAVVKDLAWRRHAYFVRLAIFVMGRSFRSLAGEFWNRFLPNNPLLEWHFKKEIFDLLKQNAAIFTATEIDWIINWIESIDESIYSVQSKERGSEWMQKRIAYDKLEWYEGALSLSSDLRISAKIGRNREICNWKRIIPAGADSSSVTGGYHVDKSPIAKEEIRTMEIPKVASFLINFGARHEEDDSLPNRSGLAREFRADVILRSAEYASNLEYFRSVSPFYLYHMFWAFRDTFRDTKSLTWPSLLEFSLEIVNDAKIWKAAIFDRDTANYEATLIGAVADLLEAGTNHQAGISDEESLKKAQEIILVIITKLPKNSELEAITIHEMINRVLGRAYEAAISIWWRLENFNQKQIFIQNKILSEYDLCLNSPFNSAEFYYSLGQGFRGFLYFNEEWVIKNQDRIFPKADEKTFIIVANGFLETVNGVYENTYDFLKKGELLTHMIEVQAQLSEQAKESLAHQILLGEIEGAAKGAESSELIHELVKKADVQTLQRITWLTSHFLREGNIKVNSYIPFIWDLIIKRFENTEIDQRDRDHIFHNIFEWPELLEVWTTEIPKLIKRTLVHVKQQYSVNQLISGYLKHYSNTTELVILAFRNTVDLKFFPIHPQEELLQLIEKLYMDQRKSDADYLCVAYANSGSYVLQTLWEKYNKHL